MSIKSEKKLTRIEYRSVYYHFYLKLHYITVNCTGHNSLYTLRRKCKTGQI